MRKTWRGRRPGYISDKDLKGKHPQITPRFLTSYPLLSWGQNTTPHTPLLLCLISYNEGFLNPLNIAYPLHSNWSVQNLGPQKWLKLSWRIHRRYAPQPKKPRLERTVRGTPTSCEGEAGTNIGNSELDFFLIMHPFSREP